MTDGGQPAASGPQTGGGGEDGGEDVDADRDSRSPRSTDPDVASDVAGDRSAFVTTTGHFYRGTLDRITTWRGRMDQTTNWAVVVMAATLTWAFSSPDNPHFVILVAAAAVLAFLVVEAHRFRQYDAWRRRVRLVEENFIASVHDGRDPERSDWRAVVGEDLRDPAIELSFLTALTHRLRRVYLFLLTVLTGAWTLRVTVFAPSEPLRETAAVGAAPGTVVAGVVAAVYLGLAGLTGWSLRGRTSREFDD